MAIIEKKIWPEYYEKVLLGDKTYEVRLADWECKTGDILVLKEWDPKTQQYTGRQLKKQITYIVKTKELEKTAMFKKEDIEKFGFQILGLK